MMIEVIVDILQNIIYKNHLTGPNGFTCEKLRKLAMLQEIKQHLKYYRYKKI